MARPTLKLISGHRVNIFEQLQCEEALLRASNDNWCILSRGLAPPKIVMGISGKAHELVHVKEAQTRNIKVIRRYSGGGTVIVDHNTLFVSFILNQRDVRGTPQYPRQIMEWSADFYRPIFKSLCPNSMEFVLQEHDYCFGENKFGGNAQSITRGRFAHHTSFLWEFEQQNMQLLTLPEKRPDYRRDRDHTEFLTPLRKHISTPETFFHGIESQLAQTFDIQPARFEDALSIALTSETRKTNQYVDLSSEIPR